MALIRQEICTPSCGFGDLILYLTAAANPGCYVWKPSCQQLQDWPSHGPTSSAETQAHSQVAPSPLKTTRKTTLYTVGDPVLHTLNMFKMLLHQMSNEHTCGRPNRQVWPKLAALKGHEVSVEHCLPPVATADRNETFIIRHIGQFI